MNVAHAADLAFAQMGGGGSTAMLTSPVMLLYDVSVAASDCVGLAVRRVAAKV